MNDPRSAIVDRHGRTVATYRADERDGRPWADNLAPDSGVPTGDVVMAILRELAGHGVTSTPDVGDALIAAGATERRRALTMFHPLDGPPRAGPRLDGITIEAYAHTAADLHPASGRAFPLGHPDRDRAMSDAQELAELAQLLGGDIVGPVQPASRVAVTADGAVVAAAIVTDHPGDPPFAGPWVPWVFRDPMLAPPGTGAAVLAAAMGALIDDGAPGVGLAVTDGNPAQRVYERLGFSVVLRTVSVLIDRLDAPAAV